MLLDTHVLIWLLYEPKKLSTDCLDKISQADAVYVSMISLWEIAIKHRLSKLPYNPEEVLANYEKAGLAKLQLREEHIREYSRISSDHKDPFDRMLLAQTKSENYTFLTADTAIIDLNLPFVLDTRV